MSKPGEEGFRQLPLWLRSPERSGELGRQRQIHPLEEKKSTAEAIERKLKQLLLFNILVKAPHTSLDGLMQEAPPALVHHIHVGFAVHQSGSNTF